MGIRRAEAKLIRETARGKVGRANLGGFASLHGGPTKAAGLRSPVGRGLLVHGSNGKGGIKLSDDLRYGLALDE